MRPPSRLIPILAGGLAATTAVLAIAALVALNGGGAAMLGDWRALELAAGYDRAAAVAMTSPRLGRSDLARAETLSRRAIELNPYDNAAWLRLASIDTLRHGRLTPAGVWSVRRSYDLVGFDPYVATWRIRFALENWQAIPTDLRPAIRAEAMALGGERAHRDKMLLVLAHVRSPAGRLTASLWASRIQRIVPKSSRPR